MKLEIGDLFTWGGRADTLVILNIDDDMPRGISVAYPNSLIRITIDYMKYDPVILSTIFRGEL